MDKMYSSRLEEKQEPYADKLTSHFHTELGHEKLKWVQDQFDGKRCLEDMFTFLWDLEESHRCLNPALVSWEKSDSEAQKFRLEGDKYFTQGSFEDALEYYNISIIAASHPPLQEGDEDIMNNNDSSKKKDYTALAAGYACRSAVLFEMNQYAQCISDIRRAELYGCPEEWQVKLTERREHCLAHQHDEVIICGNQEAGVDFEDLHSMMEKCSEIPKEAVSLQDKIESLLNKKHLPRVEEAHHSIPSLSSSLELVHTQSKGRHLTAKRDIYPGEVVGLEQSYCDGIYPEHLRTHCSTCLTECLIPLPCPYCSMVIFCSENCRIRGVSGHHWFECNVLPTLATLEEKENIVTYLAFRLISQTPFQKLQNILPSLKKETEDIEPLKRGFDGEGHYSSTEYRPLYHLVTNKDQRPSKELYETCVSAFILTKILQKGQRYFLSSEGIPFTPTREDLLLIGQLFFHHILNIFCNAFQLSDMKVTAAPVKTTLKVFGEGVFPALSLFNHSCNPTVRHYNHGNRMVLRAVTFIPAGNEVTTTYCGSFYKEDFQSRREHLLNSYIDCTCEACIQNWPVIGLLPFKLQIKCMSCSCPLSDREVFQKCPVCFLDYGNFEQDEAIQSLVDEYWTIKESLEVAESKSRFILLRKKCGQAVTGEDFSALSSFIQLLESYVQLPCQSWCYAMDTLFLIFCIDFCSPYSTTFS
ncbi:hypothetical protein SK128_012850 [Halocaridina rubra]|uniref:SET domain-containing protein n=1 Tax=Halocaridina rubra TaxID=373956 RepID=A0AAN8X9Z0_HALRR